MKLSLIVIAPRNAADTARWRNAADCETTATRFIVGVDATTTGRLLSTSRISAANPITAAHKLTTKTTSNPFGTGRRMR